MIAGKFTGGAIFGCIGSISTSAVSASINKTSPDAIWVAGGGVGGMIIYLVARKFVKSRLLTAADFIGFDELIMPMLSYFIYVKELIGEQMTNEHAVAKLILERPKNKGMDKLYQDLIEEMRTRLNFRF